MINCLCYSKDKGLYTKCCCGEESDNTIIIRPWQTKGFKSQRIKIDEEHLEIFIHSNFGFGKSSYLYAIMNKDNKRLLDYDIEKIFILNNVSVSYICVKEQDWDSLFSKIIEIYSNANNNASASAIGYIDEISTTLEKHEMFIKGALHEEKFTKWDEDFLINVSSV